jgi:hypothetical protein
LDDVFSIEVSDDDFVFLSHPQAFSIEVSDDDFVFLSHPQAFSIYIFLN